MAGETTPAKRATEFSPEVLSFGLLRPTLWKWYRLQVKGGDGLRPGGMLINPDVIDVELLRQDGVRVGHSGPEAADGGVEDQVHRQVRHAARSDLATDAIDEPLQLVALPLQSEYMIVGREVRAGKIGLVVLLAGAR